MSQVQPQVQNQPDNHDQSDVQYQPQTSDQLQSLVQIDLQSSSQSQLDIDARDFTFFSKSPLELQRDIWEIAAVPESRAIQIETICERDAQGIIHHAAVTTAADDDDDDDDDLLHWSPTKCSPTPLLGVCRDSRSIAIKHYRYSNFLDRPLFYNTNLDTLWVRGNPLFQCVSTDSSGETTLEVLFWQRRFTELGPYLFRSVALDFAGIKAHHMIVPPRGNIPQDISICTLYAVSRTEVEKVYIVYSSGECRDEIEQQVNFLTEQMKFCAQHLPWNQCIHNMLKERNHRDGLNLTEWKMPTVEAILDTRLLNPIETFHNFPNFPLELRRAI